MADRSTPPSHRPGPAAADADPDAETESSLLADEPRPRGRGLLRAAVVRVSHPVTATVLAAVATVLAVAGLLLLPVSAAAGVRTTFLEALFTATGAATGGMLIVDMERHWSAFGEVVVMLTVQLGGLGFMTSASLLGLMVSRRLGFRLRLLAASETASVGLGDVRRVVQRVAAVTFAIEGVVAVALFAALWLQYGESPGRAAYHGLFHSVSAFNNAGFTLYPDNLMSFEHDPFVLVPLAAASILGGIGFPVLFELRRELRAPKHWSMHTKVTLLGTAILLVGGMLAVTALEWRNQATLGPLDWPDKLLGGFFGSVTARTAGFNTFDYGQADSATLLVTDVLMFVGGGSASTTGGIKVTTFLVLFFAIRAEARGDDTVDAFGRQIAPTALRQALAVALLAVALVIGGTLCLLVTTDFSLDQVLFEVTSAFGTVGLTTGITTQLPAFGQYVLIVLMLVGRTGTITLASALALRERQRLYRLPEERPIVG